MGFASLYPSYIPAQRNFRRCVALQFPNPSEAKTFPKSWR